MGFSLANVFSTDVFSPDEALSDYYYAELDGASNSMTYEPDDEHIGYYLLKISSLPHQIFSLSKSLLTELLRYHSRKGIETTTADILGWLSDHNFRVEG
jgi:hypothetical protein